MLANFHVLDWGPAGLIVTLDVLHAAGLQTAGAGRHRAEAEAPAVIDLEGKGRVVVAAFGSRSSGIPRDWVAGDNRPGVHLVEDLSERTVARIAAMVQTVRRSGDVVVASVHWGPNWGYTITPAERAFAHGLIDQAQVDIVHGHSSHHAKAIEIYKGRPILYGCGDFLNDYEGISGHEAFRGDLALMYVIAIAPTAGRVTHLDLIAFKIRKFRLERASHEDTLWL